MFFELVILYFLRFSSVYAHISTRAYKSVWVSSTILEQNNIKKLEFKSFSAITCATIAIKFDWTSAIRYFNSICLLTDLSSIEGYPRMEENSPKSIKLMVLPEVLEETPKKDCLLFDGSSVTHNFSWTVSCGANVLCNDGMISIQQTIPRAPKPEVCPTGSNEVGSLGCLLYVSTYPQTWCDALSFCYDKGGQLVSVKDTEQYEELNSFITQQEEITGEFWTGFFRFRHEMFIWGTGVLVQNSHWASGYPIAEGISNASCGAQNPPEALLLVNQDCTQQKAFLCQIYSTGNL